GLGLGLYISRAIIEAHDGRISVETQEGKGSVFRIDLPLPGRG
ncbi:MAG TPA: ATP-binding protein, partial [Thermoanaerobaculia bacterium]